MARINTTGSAYRVARRKSEIARDAKWLKTAKLTAKKNQELKKRKPAETSIETPGAEDMGPVAPDNDKEPKKNGA